MCIECGCGMDTVGSGMGEVAVSIQDASKDGESGLTNG